MTTPSGDARASSQQALGLFVVRREIGDDPHEAGGAVVKARGCL